MRFIRYACGLVALFAGVAPAASALDFSELVQAGVSVRESYQASAGSATKAGASDKPRATEEQRLQARQPEVDGFKREELLTLTVRPLVGHDFPITVDSRRPLRDLAADITSKMGIPLESMGFKRNGRKLAGTAIPAKLRFKDGYVLEVSTKALWDRKLAMEGVAAKVRLREQTIAETIRAKAAAVEKKRRREAAFEAALKEQDVKRRTQKSHGTVSLRFTGPPGVEDVVLTEKKGDALGPHMKLVAKRMHLSKARFVVLRRNGGPVREIGPLDSFKTLRIREGDRIQVSGK